MLLIVRIPGHIEPLERGERFEDPLDAALQTARLGEVTGGGTQLSEPDADGCCRILFCEIEVNLTDLGESLPIVRQELSRLQVPAGTTLHYEMNGAEHEEPCPQPNK